MDTEMLRFQSGDLSYTLNVPRSLAEERIPMLVSLVGDEELENGKVPTPYSRDELQSLGVSLGILSEKSRMVQVELDHVSPLYQHTVIECLNEDPTG